MDTSPAPPSLLRRCTNWIPTWLLWTIGAPFPYLLFYGEAFFNSDLVADAVAISFLPFLASGIVLLDRERQ